MGPRCGFLYNIHVALMGGRTPQIPLPFVSIETLNRRPLMVTVYFWSGKATSLLTECLLSLTFCSSRDLNLLGHSTMSTPFCTTLLTMYFVMHLTPCAHANDNEHQIYHQSYLFFRGVHAGGLRELILRGCWSGWNSVLQKIPTALVLEPSLNIADYFAG